MNHNHTIQTAEALSLLRGMSDLREKFEDYFANGQNASEACKTHMDYLEMTTEFNLEAVLANASVNPKMRTVQHWYDVWRKANLGHRSGPEMITVIN